MLNNSLANKLKYLLALYFFLNGFVFIEPAPADILVPFGLLLALPMISFCKSIYITSLLLFGFLLANVLSLLLMDNIDFGIFTIIIRIYLFCAFVFVAFIVSKLRVHEIRFALKSLVLAALVNSLAIISLVITDASFLDFMYRDEFKLRIKGFFQDPNVLGPFLILSLSLALYLYKNLISKVCISLIILLGIFFTYSRATWLGVAIVPIIYFFISVLSNSLILNKKLLLISPVVLFTLLLIGGYFLEQQGDSRSNYLGQRASIQGYDYDRFEGQLFAINLFVENPLGYGPGSTVKREGGVMEYNDPHNVYLKVAVESGVLGLIAFVIFLLYPAFLSFKNIRKGNALHKIILANYLYVCSLGLIIDTIHWRLLFILIAIISANSSSITNEKRNNE